jgi:protoporphyrinogen oxidase
MTGLAASWISGAPALEAEKQAGGICRTYTLDGFRFETGGGHWIFGGDPILNRYLEALTPLRFYERRSSVWLPELQTFVPYPIQNNLHALPASLSQTIFSEMKRAPQARSAVLADWLRESFGPTLNDLFFGPFHELYTAGEFTHIKVQDAFKTPVDLRAVERGLRGDAAPAGYNQTFSYPPAGLDALVMAIGRQGDVRTESRVTGIDIAAREIHFADGSAVDYTFLVSTLPLDAMLALTGIVVDQEPGIRTAVLVLNLGGSRGNRMPDDHWVYVPRSRSGFHRVGFYSNVDSYFVPDNDPGLASLYVERAFPAGVRPGDIETQHYASEVATELAEWGWLHDISVVSPTWVETAYTWSRPGSAWREQAIQALAEAGILMTGRYGKWQFQGIADSLRDGFQAGAALRAATGAVLRAANGAGT